MSAKSIAAVGVILCFAVLTNSAVAAEGAKEKMIQALTDSAGGTCSEEIMSPLLLDACEQQTDANRKMLEPLGKITGTKYLGIQEMPGGKAEAYRVTFERGSMVWVASLDGSGKLLVLWSNGNIRPN
jgi:hypothetical protein